MNVTIVDTGHVGLVTGACLADLGNNVFCLDVDQAKIDLLNNGGVPTYAEVVVNLTEWKAFCGLDLATFRAARKQTVVFDGRNSYEPATTAEQGFEYFGIGRSTSHQSHSA